MKNIFLSFQGIFQKNDKKMQEYHKIDKNLSISYKSLVRWMEEVYYEY